MMKKVIRSVVLFWGIVAMFPLCYLIYAFFTVGEGSYWIFGARDGLASVTAWQDKNANGIKDNGEPPFSGVCIWYGYRPDNVIQDNSDPCQFSDYGEQMSKATGENSCPGEVAKTFMFLQKHLTGINQQLM